MKNTLISLELMSNSAVQHRPLYDRFLTLRYSATRNRLAAAAASLSCILFLLSADLLYYSARIFIGITYYVLTLYYRLLSITQSSAIALIFPILFSGTASTILNIESKAYRSQQVDYTIQLS